MSATDQAGFIGVKTDGANVDPVAIRLENDLCASNGEFAQPTLPEASPHHDVFSVGPGLELRKTTNDTCNLLCKVFHCAMQERGCLEIITDQNFVDLLLRYAVGGSVAEW